MPEKPTIFKRITGGLLNALIWLSVGLFFLWAMGAVYHLSYLPRLLRIVLTLLYVCAGLWLIMKHVFSDSKKDRWWSGRSLVAMSIGFVYLTTLLIRPSNDRDWADDQSQPARIEMVGDQVKVQNFRNFLYRSETDFDVRYETREFKLSDLSKVWFIVQKFTPSEGLAHTFLTFEYNTAEGPRFVSLSVEIWREQGDSYSPVRGLYREYELTHVVGAEQDLIGVRTVHRPQDRVYMFPVNATPAQVQLLWKKFANRITALQSRPEFYHTLLNNCTNGITGNTYELTPEPINWFDPRIVFPGYSGEFAFQNGLVGDKVGGQMFEELQRASRIDEKARSVGITKTFSADIRAAN